MSDRYWLDDHGNDEWREVTKEEYVRAERAAGFRNSIGQPEEPATSAFSTGRSGGRITYGRVREPGPRPLGTAGRTVTSIYEDRLAELRSEVSRLTSDLAAANSNYQEAVDYSESQAAEIARLTSERDEARARVEWLEENNVETPLSDLRASLKRVTHERDQERHARRLNETGLLAKVHDAEAERDALRLKVVEPIPTDQVTSAVWTQTLAERDDLRARVAAMKDVVEAAIDWRGMYEPEYQPASDCIRDLLSAVDAYNEGAGKGE